MVDSAKKGFSVGDAAAYLRCVEDVSPDLNEDTALKRMAEIRAKYAKKA